MAYIVLLLALAALVFGPNLWVQRVLAKHAAPRDDFPGTGGEFAQHLVDHYKLDGVTVEETHEGDHYDPVSKTVRLGPEARDGKSLTAIVTAAHEVGHAIQDHTGFGPLAARTKAIGSVMRVEKVGSYALFAAPIIGALTASPAAAILTVVGAVAVMGSAIVVHLTTLPVEYDASFNKALPILREGGYLPERDMPAAEQILRACAMTYVAGSLASLLNVARWISILRR
ncbi:MAG TPA: zinc metallopeptidase [Alphaproteobacteria bacterium]|nr:zinc metallopeptidase [Alphaproteobacteria bacterium]